jgi:acyl dehydratase
VGQAESAADPTYRIEAGFEFPSETLTVTAAEQRRLHDWCDIPAARYGGSADPTFLARRPILLNTASMAAARPEVGKVHIVHHLVQHRAIALDTPMTMTGRFTEIADYPRGWIAHSVWDFRTNDGASVLTVEPQVMMIDPERARQPGEGGKAAAKPAEDASGFEGLTHKQCTPETTCGYCEGTRNLIHIDPDHAKGFGFRAPIIAGNQTVNFLLEALALDRAPETFDVTIRFRRPVFWDDTLDIEGRRGADGTLVTIRAVNGDGKVVADCRVDGVTYGG